MTTRKDHLKECNDQAVALNDFKLAFCNNCYQPECTRSLYGTSKFDVRVHTWLKRLFTEVPRMDVADPRYSEINAKMFKMVNPELLAKAAQGEWVDAREVKSSSVTVPEALERAPKPVTDYQAPVSVLAAPEPAREPSSGLSRDVVLVNTPVQQGLYLPGGASTPPKPDAWGAPTPVAPGENVVQTGATVRFGSSGVEGKKGKDS